MTEAEKRRSLRKYKTFATGLFVLMTLIFVGMTLLQKSNSGAWIGYVKAFSEAAMVGALADWFAVTALFHHPLGLKIPHTNLIQEKKDAIGDNLGNFVVGNFLNPQSIRPYIVNLKISPYAADWLLNPKNQKFLVQEGSEIFKDLILKIDDEAMSKFISDKAMNFGNRLEINALAGQMIHYFLSRDDHQKLITNLTRELKIYIENNREMVQNRVEKESYAIIPKFVDRAIADKITSGMLRYADEIQQDLEHPIRLEISNKLLTFAEEVSSGEKWSDEFDKFKTNFLTEEKIGSYASDIWLSVKKSLVDLLTEEQSTLKIYLEKNIRDFAVNLQNNNELQQRIDRWLRTTIYKQVLKNRHRVGEMISATVGNWEGKELSEKLELEVGKDLQFIRVNGTLVGGLVGLVIYTLAQLLL
ncbi:Uncharacterized membrane-anchored protein YjiN, DUF445 family [Cruoricaptor ignavus]|uniref:Uncharacterized membrane-anchored protein YjiN, DUF445 family n=1 Tax=Cruoricaptor ignavus TaxID=1118202 RepID=A0A1M6FHJ9_9FLAO|nr:DUF445 domain-containing protein [Cruoricaptor ignavus]SHI97208.1 Uncharacterized membrane-anchored protein YjiN, DUF445 family [Cruoricaptor ignavus]